LFLGGFGTEYLVCPLGSPEEEEASGDFEDVDKDEGEEDVCGSTISSLVHSLLLYVNRVTSQHITIFVL
jgi:hypothetical protein